MGETTMSWWSEKFEFLDPTSTIPQSQELKFDLKLQSDDMQALWSVRFSVMILICFESIYI